MILDMGKNKRQALLKEIRHYLVSNQCLDATMQDIADHCGVSKGTLYNYFANKEDLLLVIIQDQLQPFNKKVWLIFNNPQLSPQAKIKEIIRLQLYFFQETKHFLQMLVGGVEGLHPLNSGPKRSREDYLVHHMRWLLDMCCGLMKEWIPDGKPDELEMMAFMFLESSRSHLKYYLVKNKEVDLDRDTQMLYTLFMYGMGTFVEESTNWRIAQD